MSRMSGVLLLFQHGLRMYWVLRCKVREDFLRRACGGVSNSSESSHVLRGDRWGLSRRSTDTGCHPFKKNCGDHPGCQWREHIGERIAMLISSNQTRANGWNTGWGVPIYRLTHIAQGFTMDPRCPRAPNLSCIQCELHP